ncbi:MAG: 16S rRNA (guanine(966)-N(2))-methyltransferase RsmD [Crocinitomicaceae bacterium]|nr:16S rRNA (guanine(966)-N(2))-methyltransferase RsmD [Crocinitomicaceae bacterium]
MRITGGEWRGRRLKPMKSFKGRPTTDFAREGLFNLLRSRVELEGARVLDLFAGTGMVGVECASRGAVSVLAVEKQKQACNYIKSCYDTLDFTEASVINASVFSILETASVKMGGKFDLVFADPPYDLKNLKEMPSKVRESGVLADEGLFVLEHGGDLAFNSEEGFLEMRKYGHVHFSFFTFEV